LQCVAVCCSVLQHVAACYSALQLCDMPIEFIVRPEKIPFNIIV